MRGCHAGCSPWAIRISQHEPTSHRFATTNASPETSISPHPTRSRFAPSIRLNQVERPRAVSAPVAPPPSRLSRCLLRSSQFARPTASRHRTPAPKPTPVEPPTPPERFVRAQSRCSSRASPLNPAGWHAYCNHWNAPCHYAPDKDKVSEHDSFGPSGVVGSPTRPVLPAALPP